MLTAICLITSCKQIEYIERVQIDTVRIKVSEPLVLRKEVNQQLPYVIVDTVLDTVIKYVKDSSVSLTQKIKYITYRDTVNNVVFDCIESVDSECDKKFKEYIKEQKTIEKRSRRPSWIWYVLGVSVIINIILIIKK